MRKLIIIVFIIFLFTGCSIEEININDINDIVNTIMKDDTKLFNVSANGYKYYLPNGVRVVDNTSYNEKLLSNNNLYYLYIDIASYYYQKQQIYKENNKAYFSKRLSYNDNEGYLEINKLDDQYFIEMMYNYVKIETYVEEKNINSTVINLSYILSSIQFNNSVITLLFDNDLLNFNEEQFTIFEPKGEESNFLDYDKDLDESKMN